MIGAVCKPWRHKDGPEDRVAAEAISKFPASERSRKNGRARYEIGGSHTARAMRSGFQFADKRQRKGT